MLYVAGCARWTPAVNQHVYFADHKVRGTAMARIERIYWSNIDGCELTVFIESHTHPEFSGRLGRAGRRRSVHASVCRPVKYEGSLQDLEICRDV